MTTISIDWHALHPGWCVPAQHKDDITEGRPYSHFRNGGDAHVAGGQYDLAIEQQPRPDGVGYLTGPQITVHAESAGGDGRAILEMSTGEARTLAAQLVALADRVDIPS